MSDAPISPTEGRSPSHPPQGSTPVVYYFGCEPSYAGHRLWDREWYDANWFRNTVVPRKLLDAIDGTFVPDGPGWQSSRVGPWWIISTIDNTVDTRPRSHSTFVGKGFADEAAFVAAARTRFPSVFERLKA